MRNPFARQSAPPPVLGFYGKAPAYGDFVSRGLPAGVVSAWDAVLQTLVQQGRTALGEAWLDAWLQAPVWHVCIAEAMLTPRQIRAVVIPSVDRVGRYFPFTMLAESAAGGGDSSTWHDAAEELAMTALEDDFAAETLERALRALGPPGWREGPPGTLWWCRGSPLVPPGEQRCAAWPDGALLVAASREERKDVLF